MHEDRKTCTLLPYKAAKSTTTMDEVCTNRTFHAHFGTEITVERPFPRQSVHEDRKTCTLLPYQAAKSTTTMDEVCTNLTFHAHFAEEIMPERPFPRQSVHEDRKTCTLWGRKAIFALRYICKIMKGMGKIVVAADSFKGSLESGEVADAVRIGLKSIWPEAEVVKVAVADGGEGTTDVILGNLEGERVRLTVHDPLERLIEAEYGIIDNGTTAVIEAAAACGLTLLTHEERNPMITSTYGVGEMIADALGRGCRKFIIGLGGSATNDGGMGMLSALGYKFHDQLGQLLKGCGSALLETASIDESEVIPEIFESEFIAACDVDNPLHGPSGAAFVFAPQKGADRRIVEELDRGLKHYADIVREFCGRDISDIPGAGAAGGLGGALVGFLNAGLVSGIDVLLDAIKFDSIISEADLIITGEGKIDSQTARGKVPAGILKRAKAQGIKVIALGGLVENTPEVSALGFDAILQITPPNMPLSTALQPETTKTNIISTLQKYFAIFSPKSLGQL